jgi:outer membrane protein assembly factor BamB
MVNNESCSSPLRDAGLALNATGDLIWRYKAELPPIYSSCIRQIAGSPCGATSSISRPSMRLIALDAKPETGVGHQVGDYKRGSMTLEPLVVHGKVMVGSSGDSVCAYIAAYDADSGKQVWRTTRSGPDEPGGAPGRMKHGRPAADRSG